MPRTHSYSGTMPIQFGQFALQSGDGSTLDYEVRYGAGMLSAGTSVIMVQAAVDPGDAWVTVDVWDEKPLDRPVDEWDAAATLSFTFEHEAKLAMAFSGPGLGINSELSEFLLPPGSYRVRAFGRKQGTTTIAKSEDDLLNDAEFDEDNPVLEKHLEDIALEFWPTDEHDPAATVIKGNPQYVRHG